MVGSWEEVDARVSRDINHRLASASVAGRSVLLVEQRGSLFRLGDLVPDARTSRALDSILDLLDEWDVWLDAIDEALSSGSRIDAVDPTTASWLAPVRYPRKVICIGSNYHEHIDEMHRDEAIVPKYPYSFLVPPSTGISASGATVETPRMAVKLDWEGEIAVIMGQSARNVAAAEALDYIAAYTVLNDISARDWAGPNAPPIGVDWPMAKGYDGFKPMGPYVTPSRFIVEPQDLAIRTWVNGELKQDGNGRDMIFSVAQIIEHLSGIMTLEPGDVIATGTPAGVGHGREPPEYLRTGDEVVVEISGLGSLTTHLG